MPGGLGQASLGMADPTQLPGQAQLAEAPAGRAVQRHALGSRGDRERYRQVHPGLVHAHTSDNVDEHVVAAYSDTPVTAKDRQHEREAVAVEAGHHTTWLL